MPFMRAEESLEEWIGNGALLNQLERRLYWEIGDWWNRGEKYGERAKLVQAPDWRGPAPKTLRNLGFVANRFPEVSRRRDTLLSFHHFESVVSLPPERAERLLDDIEAQLVSGGAVSRNVVRNTAKAERRAMREVEMGEQIREAAVKLPAIDKKYAVILADPPWRFDTWSDNGLDRAPDNHYPTMTTKQIKALEVPAAAHCALFLWATVPRLVDALDVMRAWDFEYRSMMTWAKSRIGTGYWFRNQTEHLILATRGNVPAPSPGSQYSSLVEHDMGRHSAKPTAFYEVIEHMFPTAPKVELFARTMRDGWDSWGAEI